MWRKLDICLSWMWAAIFFLAFAWPYMSAQPFPFVGLRKLSVEGGWSLTLETVSVTAAALWFSVSRLHTKDGMRVVQGGSIVLGILGFVYAGIPFGLAFVFFANLARQYADKLPTVSKEDGGGSNIPTSRKNSET